MMKSSTGRWVSGEDFFGRESELRILEKRVLDGNHTLLTGQRRMGKTSIARELGQRLQESGWNFLFADIEGATCVEDVIADMAQAAHPIRPISSRLASRMERLFSQTVEEIGAPDFRVKIRAGLDSGNWRRHGEELIRDCSEHNQPVLLVIDELPIFLNRLLSSEGGAKKVEEFLSWLRSAFQHSGARSPVLIVSGSIGLQPLVQRLGISDRINYLDPFRLGPWGRTTCVACFNHLANTCPISFEDGVADAVYDALGLGIPHHVQSFFARLHEYAVMNELTHVSKKDVDFVFQKSLLGPPGQNDLVHYESRLKDTLGSENHGIAMEILAETSIHGAFSTSARKCLEEQYDSVIASVSGRTSNVLEMLVHDGYLELKDCEYRFPSRLLKEWWAARFRGHYTPLEQR